MKKFALVFSISLLAPLTAFSPTTKAAFTDVEAEDMHYVAIGYLEEQGIISGYEDGTFKAHEKVNRAEALKMLTIAGGFFTETAPDKVNTAIHDFQSLPELFTDTPENAWYLPYLAAAKEKGIIEGYDDGSFRPEQNINLVEALKIYLSSFDNIIFPNLNNYIFLDTPENAWFTPYTAYSAQRGMLEINLENKIFPDQELTRGYLAEIIYRKKKSGEGFDFGKATFYGANVQGSNTASGQTFDMNLFTAAHKTLPFNTIVRVTNLANGKTVDVKITDRGPYGPGRVLDLSSGAFKEITDLWRGIINVQYEVIPTETISEAIQDDSQ
ncbi:septal ring lytic transglycosylase RlpA family protein [Candidatus Peregrinibacteria bacterium]|nr:septal ring lytic transglycosylase RlpA family protein [Candidatus Peregrinibacteria bacterium]